MKIFHHKLFAHYHFILIMLFTVLISCSASEFQNSLSTEDENLSSFEKDLIDSINISMNGSPLDDLGGIDGIDNGGSSELLKYNIVGDAIKITDITNACATPPCIAARGDIATFTITPKDKSLFTIEGGSVSLPIPDQPGAASVLHVNIGSITITNIANDAEVSYQIFIHYSGLAVDNILGKIIGKTTLQNSDVTNIISTNMVRAEIAEQVSTTAAWSSNNLVISELVNYPDDYAAGTGTVTITVPDLPAGYYVKTYFFDDPKDTNSSPLFLSNKIRIAEGNNLVQSVTDSNQYDFSTTVQLSVSAPPAVIIRPQDLIISVIDNLDNPFDIASEHLSVDLNNKIVTIEAAAGISNFNDAALSLSDGSISLSLADNSNTSELSISSTDNLSNDNLSNSFNDPDGTAALTDELISFLVNEADSTNFTSYSLSLNFAPSYNLQLDNGSAVTTIAARQTGVTYTYDSPSCSAQSFPEPVLNFSVFTIPTEADATNTPIDATLSYQSDLAPTFATNTNSPTLSAYSADGNLLEQFSATFTWHCNELQLTPQDLVVSVTDTRGNVIDIANEHLSINLADLTVTIEATAGISNFNETALSLTTGTINLTTTADSDIDIHTTWLTNDFSDPNGTETFISEQSGHFLIKTITDNTKYITYYELALTLAPSYNLQLDDSTTIAAGQMGVSHAISSCLPALTALPSISVFSINESGNILTLDDAIVEAADPLSYHDVITLSASLSDDGASLGDFQVSFTQDCSTGIATFAGGNGSTDEPWLIDNAARLDLMSSLINTHHSHDSADYRDDHYKIIAELDMGITTDPWAQDSTASDANPNGFTPIGKTANPASSSFDDQNNHFAGSLDCGGYAINNLYISNENNDASGGHGGYFVGLFAVIGSSGAVSNCTLQNAAITGYTFTGAIAGYVHSGGILSNNALSNGNISAHVEAGGIAGFSDGILTNNAVSDVTITASDSYAGGFIGRGGGTISDNTVSNAIVTANDDNAGGIAGVSFGIINNNTLSNISITASNYNAGGIAGEASGTISSNIVSGRDISASNSAGGIAGFVFANGNLNNNTVSDTLSGGVISASIYAGGIAGRTEGSLNNNTNSGGVISASTSIAGGIAGFVDDNATLTSNTNSGGVISANNDVGGIAGFVNTNATLTSNTNSGGVISANNDVGGIAGYALGDLNNNAVSNATISAGGNSAGGIAGYALGDLTSNTVSDTSITASNSSAGGIAGHVNSSGTLTSNAVSGATTITASNGAGGIVGGTSSSAIISNNAVSDATITASSKYAGGIAGSSGGTLTSSNAVANATITASTHAGGIAGYSSGDFSNNTVSGATTITASSSNAGGIAGQAYGLLSNNTVSGATTITASNGAGGIAGYSSGDFSNNTVANATITASTHAGGIAGIAFGSLGNNAVSDTSITASSSNAGGIAGQAYGLLSNNTVSGATTITASNEAGGIAGYSSGDFSNNTVSNATISASTHAGGIAGYGNGTISSNAVSNATITASNSAGGIAGYALGDLNNNAVANATISTTSNYAGGIAGRTSAIISNNAVANATISASNSNAGGIAGLVLSSGTLTSNAVSNATISASNSNAGGIAGSSSGTLNANFAAAIVTASNGNAGGVSGYLFSGSLNINNNVFIGTLHTDSGSLGGVLPNPPYSSSSTVSITNSYTAAKVTGTPDTNYGLAPTDEANVSSSASYYDNTLNTSATLTDNGQSSSSLQTPTGTNGIFANWDDTIWDFGSASQYPVLKNNPLSAEQQCIALETQLREPTTEAEIQQIQTHCTYVLP